MARCHLHPIDQGGRCTRRHALKVFAACAGGVMLGGRLRFALAEPPWGEQPLADLLRAEGRPLSLGRREVYDKAGRQAYPALALEPGGERLWTSWTQLQDGRESILLRPFSLRDESWGAVRDVTGAEESVLLATHQSDIAFTGGRLVVVWTQFDGSGWTLHARSTDPTTAQLGPSVRLAGGPDSGEIHWHPAIAPIGERAMLVWQAKRGGDKSFAILGQRLGPDGRPAGRIFHFAADQGRDCCRPAIAPSPGGRRFAVALERHEGPGEQNIYLAFVDPETGEASQPQPVTSHPASDVSPAVAYSRDGQWLWVAWHSNRRGDNGWDVTPWYRIAALRTSDNTWHTPVGADEQPPSNERGTVQGFELVRLAVSPTGVVCVLGRAAHNFYVQYYTADGKSPLYRLPEDGWGGRGRLLRGVFDGNGSLWVTRRDLGTNVLTCIDGFAGLSGPPALIPTTDHSVIPATEGRRDLATNTNDARARSQIPPRFAPRNDHDPEGGECSDARHLPTLFGTTSRYQWPEPTGRTNGLKLYFGDIHGHSWQSDGMGDPEASYLRARDVYHDDFHALTDHENFVGKRLNDAQWQEQKDLVEHYREAGSFVTLFGQEWTTPRVGRPHGWGHFNVYSADPSIPLFDHTDSRWRDLQDLYASIRKHNAIAIPHHIGWTGVPWQAIDTTLTPVVEICSVHGAFEYEGNEPIRHRGGMKGCFYRDGLKAGLRVGIVGGSDQHGLTWHHGVCWKRDPFRAGLTGLWAPALTRQAILDAFRARRTFATTGVKLQLYFTVRDELMGGVTEADEPLTIQVDVAVPPEEGRLAWLEIVRDGQVIHRYGGEGQRSRYTFTDELCPLLAGPSATATCSYYLRVRLTDNNMAWSSPVWLTRPGEYR